MTREEAINEIKKATPYLWKETKDALGVLIPEFAENENIIRRKLIGGLKLMKHDGKEFFGSEPIDNCITWLENQKDASKATEAVERIDKYIDEHLANAHDMKDSNPDKKYYRGWDDALGKMAGILQDVYSDEKQKEQEKEEVKFVFPKFLYARTTNNKTIDVSYAPQSLDAIEYIRSDSFQQEQPDEHYTKRSALFDECVKNCDPEIMKKVSDEIDEMLQKEPSGKLSRQEYLYQLLIDQLITYSDYEYLIGQKLEWSEEDKRKLQKCIKIVERWEEDYDIAYAPYSDMLKSLRPQSKEELAKMLQDEYNKGKETGEREGYTKGYNKGYKDAEEAYNNAVSYHFPTFPVRPLCWEPGGTCTNPQMDCVNCPRKTTGGFNTTYGTSTATLHGNISATDGKEHNPSFID